MSIVINDILLRLAEARRRDNGAKALAGLLLALAILGSAGLVLLGIETVFWLSVTWRTLIMMLGMCAVVGIILWLAGIPFARRLGVLHAETDLETAGRVGRAHPQIHDRLLNVVQLAEQRASASAYYSDELLDAALEDTRRDVAPIDFSSIVDRGPLRTARRLLLAGVALAALLGILLPRDLGQASYRLMHFRQPFSPPAAFSLLVEPGSRDIVKGESVEVIVRVQGATREPVEALMRPDGQVTIDTHTLSLQADGTYRYRLDGLRLSTSYRIRSGDVETEEYLLRVLDRPSIVALQLRLTYPRHTGLPSKDLDENIGDVTAPAGTLMRLSLRSNKALTKATMRFSDSTHVPLVSTGTSAEGTLMLRDDRIYHLDIVDNEILHNTDPIEYAIHVIPDAPPTITIVSPGMNLNVAGNELLPMVFRVTDDYGISRLRLAHKLIHSK